MQTFIHLLIGLLIGLLLRNMFTVREGAGPMVGSIMFPTSYRGKTDVEHKPIKVKEKTDISTQKKTDLVSKKDVRVDTDIKSQHWHESKKDVDEKKDVDIMHRYPQVWNTASIEDCNKKKNQLFKNHVQITKLQKELKYLTEWLNKLVPTIKSSENKNKVMANNILQTSKIIEQKKKTVMDELNTL